jgi:hypothetical protein
MPGTNTAQSTTTSGWLLKFIECVFVGFAVWNVFNTLMEVIPENLSFQSGNRFLILLNAALLVAALVFALVYPFYWQRKEKKLQTDMVSLHVLFQGIIRYWIAFEVSRYGFAKLFQTQFLMVYSREDAVVSQLDGYNLTWNYFGHSYTLAVIIGLLQIAGSIFLLFRRTSLLGAVILLPILLNIALIDWFFDIAWGALMNAVAFTLGLAFLVSLRWKELKAVLLRSVSHLPVIFRDRTKYVIRIGLMAVSFAMVIYFTTFNSHKALAGKWNVSQIIRNGDTLSKEAWLTDSTAWKNIYIEQYGRLALCPNPYCYEAKRSQWARYEYDSIHHQIQLVLLEGSKKDTINLAVSFLNNSNQMNWKSLDKQYELDLVISKSE